MGGPVKTLPVTLIRRTRATALYRTMDGQYDIVGVDLNCTTPAARAAGAGPVWWWLLTNSKIKGPAFTSRTQCLKDLQQHMADKACT